ncbi:SDR family NAD(P)-dependent oxidoreductase [Streptomyces brasiliensis]|uniref:SDR family NAD(P)-dependent oxidoreductase n=1 Tax=Streptomyces brasiliensis TaxID=1954 RepID=A0A917NZ97_9ACTN|nr:SDR family NAD(P)-dependent oxidoreductase [Streptomyces brasiliensis]GGJ42900.1 hypothetical protein GCM10010121_062680 [Streptomyces brasiliensis]
MTQVPDRVALVTGAARGIGAAVTRRLAGSGHTVVALDWCVGEESPVGYPMATRAELDAVVAGQPEGRVLAHVADVRDPEALRGAVGLALQTWGRLDVVVAGAAVIAGGSPAWEPRAADDLALQWDVDVRGVWNTAAAAIPAMLAGPDPAGCRFVVIASAAGAHGLFRLAAYTAAQHAVVGLVKGLAAERLADGSMQFLRPGRGDDLRVTATARRRGRASRSWTSRSREQRLAGMGVALLAGLVNAIFVVVFGVSSLVVTLGMGTVLLGLAELLTNNNYVTFSNPALKTFARNQIFTMPMAFYYGIFLALVMAYVLAFTPVGRSALFAGANREVARLTGIRVGLIRFGAYLLGAAFAGFAGVLIVASVGSFDNSTTQSYLLPALAAVFLSTAVIHPDTFNPIGAVIAIFFLQTGIIGLQLMGSSTWVINVFYGGGLVVAVTISKFVRDRTTSHQSRSGRHKRGSGCRAEPLLCFVEFDGISSTWRCRHAVGHSIRVAPFATRRVIDLGDARG